MFETKRRYFFLFLFIRSIREFLALLPTLRALKQTFPYSQIEILTSCRLEECDVESLVDRFIYNSGSLLSLFFLSNLLPIFDVGFIVNSLSSSKISCLLRKIRYLIGFSGTRCSRFLTHEVKEELRGDIGDHYFNLLKVLVPFSEFTSQKDFEIFWKSDFPLVKKGRFFIDQNNLLSSPFVVVEAPSSHQNDKSWPMERFCRLVSYIFMEQQCRVIVVSDDSCVMKKIPLLQSDSLFFLSNEWFLLVSVIAYSSLVISFDSEVAQVAQLFGKEVGGLFSSPLQKKNYTMSDKICFLGEIGYDVEAIKLKKVISFVEEKLYCLSYKERIVLC